MVGQGEGDGNQHSLSSYYVTANVGVYIHSLTSTTLGVRERVKKITQKSPFWLAQDQNLT